jgi:hypothetical protein
MAPTTCYGYKRRYHNIEALKKQIIIHGKNAGVIIADNNDGPVLSIDDFIKVSPKILSRKRPRIEEHSVPVVKSVPMNVVDGTEQPMEQALALVQEADATPVPMVQSEQPMEQAQTPVPMVQSEQPMEQPMAEQPIEQPMEQAQTLVQEAEQPMEQAQTLVQEAEQPMEQAQTLVQEANAVPVQALIASSTAHLPNDNGARRVVPTNTLVLNGLIIEVDPDTFMVNATQMCKAAGKRWVDYRKNNTTEGYLKAIESKVRIITFDLIRSKPGHNGGTMVHLLIALDLASWLSDDVRLQFNMWNAELLLTGRVQLGNEMSIKQLEEIWKRLVDEVKAKASADLSGEQDRCQEIILQRNELEQRIVAMEEDHRVAEQHNKKLMAIKTREDLKAAIQFQVNTTAPTIATYKEGDNVLYLARIDETKFKYGHTKNLKQRLEAHGRRGVYPTLELVWIVKSNNGVASEDQLHAYVKKKKIIAEYGTQREIISLESVDDLERMLKKMNKCALPRADADIDIRRMEEETKRMEIIEKTKQMEINAKTKQMEINPKTMLMQMLANKTITFEQYLQIKD